MNSSVVMFPVSRNVEGPVGAGVIYSLMLEKAEWRRFIWLNMLMSFVWRFDTVDGEAADKQAIQSLACCSCRSRQQLFPNWMELLRTVKFCSCSNDGVFKSRKLSAIELIKEWS